MTTSLFARVTITYGIDAQNSKRHTQHFRVDNINSTLFGNPGVAVEDPGNAASVDNLGHYIQYYTTILKEITYPGISILGAVAEAWSQDDFTGEQGPISTVFYNVYWPGADAAHKTKRGPRGSMFFWAKQRVLITGKEGGIHWGYISGDYAALPTSFAGADISAVVTHCLQALTGLSAPILSYSAPTKTQSTYTQYVDKTVPSALLYFGIVNG